MDLSNLLRAIFDQGAEGRLDAAVETQLIAQAKLGDEAATSRLLIAYAPAIRSGVSWYVRSLANAPRREDLDDVRSQAVLGVLEAIQAHDATVADRLAGIVASYVRNALSTLAGSTAQLSIPERTLKRFAGILREAEGNVERALELAPTHEMKRETFLAVLAAVRDVDSIDVDPTTTPGEGGWSSSHELAVAADAVVDVEDRILVEAALRAVDDTERNVVALAYGFADYDAVPDAEIGERMGYSRAKVQRTRTTALGKMRHALGVA